MSTQTKPSRIMHNDDKLDQIKLYQLYKGNNKITELRTILQRESQNS